MFKNDRMMLILTGLVLAIFAGSMVQYGDRIMGLMGGESVAATQDDSYSVRAGSNQILDVLSNDEVKGPIVVLSRPSCGLVELTSNNRLSFSSAAECNGVVEFAYCVDADGACNPNAVKINVISVNLPQSDEAVPANPDGARVAANTNTTSEENGIAMPLPNTSAQNTANAEPTLEPPVADAAAPEIATFSVEMSPPTLAAPSVSELVSPSVAVASIRRSTSGLDTASITDQNIATQNTASIGQTASSGPSAFAAPEIGGASNIALGGIERVTVSNVPTGLQPASNTDGNSIVPLERGPVALASLQPVRPLAANAESAPYSGGNEAAPFTPVVVASAKAQSPSRDTNFRAEPISGGPIALVALNPTSSRGAADGESLNVILLEPGLQSFSAPDAFPTLLAPVSARPDDVSVMEHGPNVVDSMVARLNSPAQAASADALASRHLDPLIARQIAQAPTAPALGTAPNARGLTVQASYPVMVSPPSAILLQDTISPFISASRQIDTTGRIGNLAALTQPNAHVFSKPSVNLNPAQTPPIVQASLPETPTAPIITAPSQNSACDVSLAAQVRSGARIQLEILAPCKPNQMVTIEHAGLAFSVLTDAQGSANVQFPAMEAEAEISARFADQSSSSTMVSVRDIDSVVRTGLSWQSGMDLNLTAIEFGAAIGSEGYISAATPRDYRTSRIKGGGYLLQLGDPNIENGALAEVYTLPVARNQQRGTIAMSISIRDAASVCGQTIIAKTVRTRDGGRVGIRNVRFTVPACGSVSGQIMLPGAVDDIRLAGR